eukprot:scaffold83595_cov27-Tisochrysis_lutea.AAC.2
MHGPHGLLVLPYDVVYGAAAFRYVAPKSSDEAKVRLRVNKNLDVACRSHFWLRKDENALHEDDVCWVDMLLMFALSGVRRIIVDRNIHRFTFPQFIQMSNQQRRIEGVWMVKVDLCALFKGEMGKILVVRVVGDVEEIIAAEALCDGARDRSLSRARAARDTHHDRSCSGQLAARGPS